MHSINYFVSRKTQLKFQVLFVKTAATNALFLDIHSDWCAGKSEEKFSNFIHESSWLSS